MRIVIDLQAMQSNSSANRGIGRYTRSLVDGMLRNAPKDDFILLLNGMIGKSNDLLKREFEAVWPNVTVRVWTSVKPASFLGPDDHKRAAAAIREAVIVDCRADVVLVTSLFEGLRDDCVATVGRAPTAVILYDLIPHIFPGIYLEDAYARLWYQDKLEAMKRADLLLAISECSARDGINYLGLSADRVQNISSDVHARFARIAVDEDTRHSLLQGLGLSRPFLMYTGGIDHRKNIPALITAFASLPRHIIDTHQLAVVCQVNAREKTELLCHAHAAGLSEDSVVMTGYVRDEALVTLYNLCSAFVFPSWYEGFGLPVLEAMRCGAAVIGANTSSVPEVIGREDALFDPRSTPDMAKLIEKVLVDEEFRQSLRDSGAKQSARFNWDQTARRALSALRSIASQRAAPVSALETVARKPRLAFVSPMPPERSGISFYSAELLPALSEHYDIDLIVNQATVAEVASAASFPIRSIQWLRDHVTDYDRILYQFGNSHFHSHMFDLLDEIPGVVVLHDFFLSGIERALDPLRFTRLLAENHGYHAALDRYNVNAGRDGLTEAVYNWPVNTRAIAAAEGVVVHSEHSCKLARQYCDPSTVADWAIVPHLRLLASLSEQGRMDARRNLGIDDDEILICTFGHISKTKLPFRLIDGLLLSKSDWKKKVRLVFVGEGDVLSQTLLSRLAHTPLQKRVHITGWVPEDLYRQYLQAADFAIQLRSNSRGESSGAVLDCQNFALPVIVNAHGSLADLPSDTVLRISDDFSDLELSEAIDRLVGDPDLRKCIGRTARALVTKEHSPEFCARAYRDAIESFHQRPRGGGRALITLLSELPYNPVRDSQLAQAMADSLPSGARLRQILIDVGGIVQSHAETDIQGIVRDVLREWLHHPPHGWRVEPVFADPALGRYRYARRFTCSFLKIPDDWAEDFPIDFSSGDVFLGLDPQPELITQMHQTLVGMSAADVRTAFVVHDLPLPLLPHHFPMLQAICRHDQLLCTSRYVMDELQSYLRTHPLESGLLPRIELLQFNSDWESTNTLLHSLSIVA